MMQDIFEKLRTLQDILSQKYEIEREIKDIPKILATKTELMNRLKKLYLQKNEEYEAIKKKIEELKKQMAEAEKEREKYEKQMDVIKTQREYEALDKEIKDASQKELDVRQELEGREKKLEEMKTGLDKETMLIQNQEEEVKQEQSRIKQEIKEKTKSLQKMEKEESKITPGLDEDILFKFERIIRSKSGLGIVSIIKNVCTGCHMILPAQYVNDVRDGNKIMFCPECSRILYFQESDQDVNMDTSSMSINFPAIHDDEENDIEEDNSDNQEEDDDNEMEDDDTDME